MTITLADIEKINQNLEVGGWVKGIPHLPNLILQVRGRWNSDYLRRYNELTDGLTPEQQKERADEIETTLLVETIWTGWNLDLPFSQEVARQSLTNPNLAVLRRGVIYASNVVTEQGAATLEDAAKN